MTDYTTVSIRPETKAKMDSQRPEGVSWDQFIEEAFDNPEEPEDSEIESAISLIAQAVERAGGEPGDFEDFALSRFEEAGVYGGDR